MKREMTAYYNEIDAGAARGLQGAIRPAATAFIEAYLEGTE
jgi:hypothetical protein